MSAHDSDDLKRLECRANFPRPPRRPCRSSVRRCAQISLRSRSACSVSRYPLMRPSAAPRRAPSAAQTPRRHPPAAPLVRLRDVPRPAWFTVRRQRIWHPILNRAPSKRRAMILEDILAGVSYRQTMRKEGIALSTVSMQAAILYQQHRVKGPGGAAGAAGWEVGEVRNSNIECRNGFKRSNCGERGSSPRSLSEPCPLFTNVMERRHRRIPGARRVLSGLIPCTLLPQPRLHVVQHVHEVDVAVVGALVG